MPRMPKACECDCHVPVNASEDIKLKLLESKLVPRDLSEFESILSASNNSYLYVNDNGDHKKISAANLLANYYKKAEVDQKLIDLKAIRFEVVAALPAVGQSNIIYLVPKPSDEENVYDEYIWVDKGGVYGYERIGSTSVDLSAYRKAAEQDYLDALKQNRSTLEEDVAAKGFTKNIGTITGVKMNGESKGTSGDVDLGTVITAHQDISGKQDKVTAGTGIQLTDTNILNSIVGKTFTTNVTVGHLTSGTAINENMTVKDLLYAILYKEAPTTIDLYYGASTNAPIGLTGLTKLTKTSSELSQFTQNIKCGDLVTYDPQHPVMACPVGFKMTEWANATSGISYMSTVQKVVIAGYNIYYKDTCFDADIGGEDYLFKFVEE